MEERKRTCTSNPIAKYAGIFIFIVSLLVFVVVQTYLVYAPIRERLSPVDGPVAFGYILKAEQMNSGCFLQDCPALLDLREQLSEPATDVETGYTRIVEYHRVFVIYHPLHSLMLAGLENAGLSYEQAYDLIALLGKLLICFGIAYWLHVIYGRGPTTIALLLLTPLIFVGQGLQSIVPSNIALGICLVLWAIILQRNPKMHWTLIPLLLAALLMHQIGRLYGLIALALYFGTADFPLTRRDRVFVASGLVLITITFLAPVFIHHPELSSDTTGLYPVSWDYFDAMVEAITQTSWPLIEFWFRPLGSAIVVLLLIAFCIADLGWQKRKLWLILAFLLAGFLIFSMVYVDPWYGSLVFERAWVPMGIFLTGALGLVIFVLLRTIYVLGKKLIRRQRHKVKSQRTLLWLVAALALAMLAFRQAVVHYVPYYARHYELTLVHQTDRLDFRLDASQPELIAQNDSVSDQTIIYMGRVQLYYYLSHGGQNYGAVFFPALVENQLQEPLLQTYLKNAEFLVSGNPVYGMQENPELVIELDDNAKLSVEGTSNLTFTSFKIFVTRDGQPIDLEIEWHEGQDTMTTTLTTIANGTSGWITLSQAEIEADSVVVKVVGTRGITVNGISFDQAPLTNWPWEVGILLTLTPEAGNEVTIELSEEALVKDLPIEIDVIDDDGMTVLARVLH